MHFQLQLWSTFFGGKVTSPPGPLRTVRESLDSYGSHRSSGHRHKCQRLCFWPGLFLFRVGRIEPQAEQRCPFGPVPLQNLQPYYGHLCPCAPHRYSGSCGVHHLSGSLRIGTTGSHVPHRSLIHVHAAYMPDASRVLGRLAPTFIPGYHTLPSFGAVFVISTRRRSVHFRSSPWISRDAVVATPFHSTLTTKALYPSSLSSFGAHSCKPAPGGPPPSSIKHHHSCALPPFCDAGSSVRDTRAA